MDPQLLKIYYIVIKFILIKTKYIASKFKKCTYIYIIWKFMIFIIIYLYRFMERMSGRTYDLTFN